jgi:type VI secretion system protein ImpM
MSVAVSSPVAAGFFGKLPARGDFVRTGLPRDFTDPWDAWLSAVMSASRTEAGNDWLPAFLEAPVWRFLLPAGLCSPRAAIGLMLPSVDRAGRYYPLTFAALTDNPGILITPESDIWLDCCEAAGRSALAHDATPDWIAMTIGRPALTATNRPVSGSEWWTEGSTRVHPARLHFDSFPEAADYAAMLGTSPQAAQSS